MISYKNTIFRLFGPQEKRQDINKDVDGKGTYERYSEVVGNDIDEELKPYIDNLGDNLINPDTIQEQYLFLREADQNITLSYGLTAAKRKAVLRHFGKLVNIKGTKAAYRLMFGTMDVDSVVTRIPKSYGLDSPVTFDSPDRRFDEGCRACLTYSIDLTGVGPLNAEKLGVISSIINFNHPINGVLQSISYNGISLGIETPSRSNNYRYIITE